MSSISLFIFHLSVTIVLFFIPVLSYHPELALNFTSQCNRKLTCLEFIDCCRSYTDAICPIRAQHHCTTGVNGKPIDPSLQCDCDGNTPEPASSIGDATLGDTTQTIVSSCRTLMGVFLDTDDPCRVFATCCDVLLGQCISADTGRSGRKSIYCTKSSIKSSYCECIPHHKDQSVFDLRMPITGLGSLTQTCLYDSNNCKEFTYCCRGYLDTCPGRKRELCVETEVGIDKTLAVCQCEFSRTDNNARVNKGQFFFLYAIGLMFWSSIFGYDM